MIKKNQDNIKHVIKTMIQVYELDNTLHERENPEDDWIREYLYEHIKYPAV
jgi:hypothetical protein